MEKIEILERLRNYMSPIVTHFEIIDQMDSLKIQGQINTAKMILADNRKMCNEVLPKIVSLLNTEKELVVLDAPAASDGVYSEVRNSECEADLTEDVEQTSGATLETRIEDENEGCHRCPYCGHKSYQINEHYSHMEFWHGHPS